MRGRPLSFGSGSSRARGRRPGRKALQQWPGSRKRAPNSNTNLPRDSTKAEPAWQPPARPFGGSFRRMAAGAGFRRWLFFCNLLAGNGQRLTASGAMTMASSCCAGRLWELRAEKGKSGVPDSVGARTLIIRASAPRGRCGGWGDCKAMPACLLSPSGSDVPLRM